MLERLLGLETEYAIRYSPRASDDGHRGAAPSNEIIFNAIADAVCRLVTTHPGERSDPGRWQIFTQNGGALYYEAMPNAPSGGTLEASTPECSGPSQLLLYQKAQEALLLRAIPLAQERLHAAGWDGEIGLIKNCRDAQGHVYGAQENYEVDLARGPMLWLYRIGLALLLPVLPLEFVFFWLTALAVFGSVFATVGIAWLLGRVFPSTRRFIDRLRALIDEKTERGRRFGSRIMWIEYLLYVPIVVPYAALLHLTAFRTIRRTTSAFILTRSVLSGTGTLFADRSYALSEKGPAMRRMMRTFIEAEHRPVFDTGNLVKGLIAFLHVRVAPLWLLFEQRQRMQLGFSDSNGAQIAEYLKIGTTALVIDMAEAGFLKRAPRLKRPIDALHAVVRDPSLRRQVEVRGGKRMTALQLQRWYLEQAREFVARSPLSSLEAREVVRLWGEALDALEQDPSSLIGRLDWVTKRFLIEGTGDDLDFDAKKKIDLKYHELGSGYLAQMERMNTAPTLVSEDEVARAIETPPQDTPARTRGRLIRELAGTGAEVTVSWDSIRIGGRIGGRVIRLDDYRSRT